LKPYKRLSIYGNRKRAHFLAKFHDLVHKYFTNGEGWETARSDINYIKSEAHQYILDTGVPHMMIQYPAPMVGGHVKHIELVENIFDLKQLQVNPLQLLDVLQQSIGVYEADREAALVRTINPLFWLGKFLRAISAIPFAILEHAGLHGKKYEDSFMGRLLRLITEIAAVGGIVFAVLVKIGKDKWLLDLFR
jgi:hypothetical protein